MKYSTPELVVLGPASSIVLGGPEGEDDSSNPTEERPQFGLLIGLDD
jgi:hypothetical protein